MNKPKHVVALIVAAGRGTRMGGGVPKQYQYLGGKTVLSRTVARFSDHPGIDDVVVVIGPDHAALASSSLPPSIRRIAGGESRDASVRAGLAALGPEVTHVLIHDGARPLVPAAVIGRVIAALDTAAGAAPAIVVTDALWRGTAGHVEAPVSRENLWRAQTPQGFALPAIRAAHERHEGGAADDVEIALSAGLKIAIVEGHEDNIKLTHPADTARAERVLSAEGREQVDIRLGNGFDVHRFGPGDAVTLCGVTIPHSRGLQGHSDADVGMHALTDAIYGALAAGDIGQHFPPSDPQWKGARSDIFLEHAVRLAAERGFRVGNADCTLICEQPKIGPNAQAMRERLAGIIGVEPRRISVKATTSEQLGFTGREEGIAALATVTLISG